jgi:hypothetical protein
MRRLVSIGCFLGGLAVWMSGCAQQPSATPTPKSEGKKDSAVNLQPTADKPSAGGMSEEDWPEPTFLRCWKARKSCR